MRGENNKDHWAEHRVIRYMHNDSGDYREIPFLL